MLFGLKIKASRTRKGGRSEDPQNQLPVEDREAWFRLRQEHKEKASILPTLALYWADGKRTLQEIIELVELDHGERAGELLVKHFELLEKMGLIELRE